MLQDRRLREDLIDIAIAEGRTGDKSRPFREFLSRFYRTSKRSVPLTQEILGPAHDAIYVDSLIPEEALTEADIGENEEYEVVEVDDFEDRCLLSAITDDTLFGP